MIVPFHRIASDAASMARVMAVLESGWWTCGPEVAKLEGAAREITGSRYAIAVNSCATALKICTWFRCKSRDESCPVLPAFGGGFFCSAFRDAFPDGTFVLSDCDETLSTHGDYALDYGGHPVECSDDAIVDAAYSFGTPGDSTPRGLARCYSFQATKPITSGEGGMIVTDNNNLAIYARRFRTHGMDRAAYDRTGLGDYDVTQDGGGYLMTDFQAALILGQLSGHAHERSRQRRIAIAREYDDALPAGICPIPRDEKTDNVGLYAVRIGDNRRAEFREFLYSRGVATRRHYPPVWSLTIFRDDLAFGSVAHPMAEAASREVVTLPIFCAMTDEEVRHVCETIKEFAK